MPKKFKKRKKIQKHFTLQTILFFLFLLIIFSLLLIDLLKNQKEILICGDETLYGECSLTKPYFCLDGTLIEKASICNCSEILMKSQDLCISKYQSNPKNITLKYILRGEEKELEYVVYRDAIDYFSNFPKSFDYKLTEKYFRKDFILKKIEEKEQRELLLSLVIGIQNIAKDQTDQVRIAVSIVQNLQYNNSGEIIDIGFNNDLNYSRYPYEVLYDMEGVCGERSELLIFLLKEMGYGVVLFHYPLENHQTVGIKCPVEHSLNNSGYCFIETTGPSIITNNKDYYVGGRKLSSEPEIIFISDGNSLSENLYEYRDSKNLIRINKIIEEKGKINLLDKYKLEKIKKRYGLYFLYSSKDS